LQANQAWAALEMWEQAEVLLAHAARLVDVACTPEAAALQQQENAAAGSSAWAGASAAERHCLMVFDVHSARYVTAWNLGQQVRAHLLAGH
jgi:hypothetical protein